MSLTLHSAAGSLPSPPVSWGYLAAANFARLQKEFDLEIWADEAASLSDLTLVGAVPKPITISDGDSEGQDTGADTLTLTSHAYQTGDGPVRLTTSGALPAGLALATDYWIEVVDANTISLHASLESVLAGSSPVDISAAGSGTHTISDTADTKRLRWLSLGLLGHSGDGAIEIAGSSDGYSIRINHRPPVLAYALVGTTDAAISAALQLVR